MEKKEIQDERFVILQRSSDLLHKEIADLVKQKANNSKDAASFISREKALKRGSRNVEEQH